MTISDTVTAGKRPRFGVFARLGELLSLTFRRRPGVFLGLGLLLFIVIPVGVVSGLGALMSVVDPEGTLTDTGIEAATIALAVFVSLASWLLGTSVLTVVGCDELAGERRSLGAALRHSARRLHIVFLLGLVASFLVALGSVVIGILGLWVAACFSAFMPALVWEGRNWGALGRSQRLTRDYRLPIMGLIVLLYLGGLALFFGSAFFIEQVPEDGSLVSDLLLSLPVLIQIALFPVFCALPPVVHARLLAIKEADSGAELRAVFE
ncbi:hypothetical protein [Aureimonas sp. ME7]|uniref:hypothetical protein n=1 Tax=Aureimonas sp. ME7 TaxID=2744252 RepID=UPI0015F621BC|nr:hypothetical protein [Aureimonas sp. ME7]